MTIEQQTIQRESLRRRITRLCHFTQSRKLMNILHVTGAILPTRDLKEHYHDLLDVTDELRLDGRLDHVCCSVQYPNVFYYETVARTNPNFQDWVILALRPQLMWERNNLFCPRNAATARGVYLQAGVAGWQTMFQEAGFGGYNRTAQQPHNCPTDNQAEVLIPGAIPASDITAVIVPSRQALGREIARLRTVGIDPTFEWRVAPALFTKSLGWDLRRGQLPTEVVVRVEDLEA